MRPAAALLALLAATAGTQEPVPAPEPAARAPQRALGFRHETGRIPAGRVHHYERTDADGAPGELALFLAGESRFEALRSRPGVPGATLLVGEIDWEISSLASLERWRVDERGERALEAELELSSDRARLVARAGGVETSCALARVPWDAPELDFATLGIALRFLEDPRGEVEIGIVGARAPGGAGSGGAGLVDRGPATLAYVGEEEHGGLDCRSYSLAGPGLEHGGASLWAARGDEAHLVGLELAAQPGARPVRLEWRRNETLSAGEWEALVRNRAGGGAR